MNAAHHRWLHDLLPQWERERPDTVKNDTAVTQQT